MEHLKPGRIKEIENTLEGETDQSKITHLCFMLASVVERNSQRASNVPSQRYYNRQVCDHLIDSFMLAITRNADK